MVDQAASSEPLLEWVRVCAAVLGLSSVRLVSEMEVLLFEQC